MIRLLFVFVLSISCVFADESEMTGQQWLEKMSHAMETYNYHGTVAFFKSGRLDTMKYFHATNEGLQQERLLSLNSPMREVIREGGKVSCVFKKSNKVVVNHRPVSGSFIVDLPTDFSASNSVYQFSLKGEESVAMLPSRVISIEAKDPYRYSRKIWIDKQFFLPLKIEVYDLSGARLEQVVFTDLQVVENLAIVRADSNIEITNIKHIHQEESSAVEMAGFVLENVPAGFQTIFFTRMNRSNSEQAVDHLLLSDGFSSISVYRELKEENIQLGLQTLGTVNSFTHVIDDFEITVMGEVPAETVQFIAQGIKFR